MACNIILKNLLLDTTPGGQWELLGFSTIEIGPYSTGGNWPWSTNSNENIAVITDNLIQGYYKLNYFTTGACPGNQELIVPVVGNGDAGSTVTIYACNSSTNLNISNSLGVEFDPGVLQASFIYQGSGVDLSEFSLTDINNPTTAFLDLSTVAAGTYLINLSIIPQNPPGYILANCCIPSSSTLILNVIETEISISIDPFCNIQIDNVVGCGSGALELWKKPTGGSWTATGITSFPHSVANDTAEWKVVGTGCDCTPTESNVVDSAACCNTTNVTLNVTEYTPCYLVAYGNYTNYGGNEYEWYKSCDNGVTWNLIPGATNNYYEPTDDCCYKPVLVYHPNDCRIQSGNHVCVNCGTPPCNDTITGIKVGCTYQVTAGLYCDGGSLKLNKYGSSQIQTIILPVGGSYPQTFNIDSDGNYFAALHCGGSCPPIIGATQNYTGCNPTCTSVFTTSLNGCTITASVTNCPGAIYTFYKPDGSVAYSGTNNSYVGDIDGTWTITVSGCTNCPTLSSTETLSGCENQCNCVAYISETSCGLLVLNLQACIDYDIEWYFRIGTSGVWTGIQTGGVSHQAANNGYYYASLNKPGCTIINTLIEQVTCITPCDCVPNITIIQNVCTIDGNPSNCTGYTLTMQHRVNNVWTDIGPFNAPWSYSPVDNNLHRIKATKSGCPDVYSNTINVTCVGTCQVVIDSFIIDPNDCDKIIVSYSGAGGSNVIAQFSYAQVNPTDCSIANGWATISGSVTGSNNTNGTGTFTLTIPEVACGSCIRVIVDATGESCGIVTDKLFVECCCMDEPSIQETVIMNTYEIKVSDSNDLDDHLTVNAIQDSDRLAITGNVKVWKTTGGITTLHSTEILDIETGLMQTSALTPNTTASPLITGDYIVKMDMYDENDIAHTIYLEPNNALTLKTGSAGTVTNADLTYDSNNPTIFENAIHTVIQNYAGSVSKIVDLNVSMVLGTYLKIKTKVHHNVTIASLGIKNNNWNITTFTGGSNTTDNSSSSVNGSQSFVTQDSSPCGPLSRRIFLNAYDTNNVDYDFVALFANPNSITYPSASGSLTPILSCSVHTLTIINQCTGSTYLWSNGEITASIEVPSGNYSCVVTCPDGCDYTLNITV